MAAKVFSFGYQETQILVLFVQRQSDGLFLQSDGTFGSGSDSPLPFVELFDGFYQASTDVAPWMDGFYNVLISRPDDTGHYFGLQGFVERIAGDTQIGFAEASSITSRNAVSALRTLNQNTQAEIISLTKAIGVISDRIDSLQQILSRRDYPGG